MARTVEPFPTPCAREKSACGDSGRKSSDLGCGCPTGEPGRPSAIAARTVARFEHGEAILYPLPDTPNVYDADLRQYAPDLRGRDALYFAVDVTAVDALVSRGGRAWPAIAERLPAWVVNSPGDDVFRRALECGIQAVDLPPAAGTVSGVPGVCLRWVNRAAPTVPLLPGMARILIYAYSPTGRDLLDRFPVPAILPPRQVVASVDDALAGADS